MIAAMRPLESEGALVVRSADPLNGEAPIWALARRTITPTAHFYVRNHFATPTIDGERWRLRVGGRVTRPLRLGLQDLYDFPARVETVTLECAGNGRSSLHPSVGGEQWGLGAISTAEWTGVRLIDILDRAGVEPAAHQVVFRGADEAAGEAHGGANRFERSLTLEDIHESGALVAYAMNGDSLPPDHGYPVRLVVPGWYGVASVKWLTDIRVIGRSFRGHFQTDKYMYEWEREGKLVKEPVRLQKVRALITQPLTEEAVATGDVAVQGLAWSGSAPIARVEVSVDGQKWQPARLTVTGSRHEWQRWDLMTRFDRPGRATIRARATDLAGHTQPEQPEWNRLGYGNNCIHEISIHVGRGEAGVARA